jgi:hypothetical protein
MTGAVDQELLVRYEYLVTEKDRPSAAGLK